MRHTFVLIILTASLLHALISCKDQSTEASFIEAYSKMLVRDLSINKSRLHYQYFTQGVSHYELKEKVIDTIVGELKTRHHIKDSKCVIRQLAEQTIADLPDYNASKSQRLEQLNDRLMSNNESKMEELSILYDIIEITILNELDGFGGYSEYGIKPYFLDTIFLSSNFNYSLPIALFDNLEASKLQPNTLRHNMNSQTSIVEINTAGMKQGEIQIIPLQLALMNPITNEEYVVRDSLVLKIVS